MATNNQLNGLLQLPEENDGIPGISFSSGGGTVDKVNVPPRVQRKRDREQKKRDKAKLKAAREEVRKDLERGDFVHPDELSRVGLLPNGEVDKDFILQAGGFGFNNLPGGVLDPDPYTLGDIPGIDPSPDYPGNRPVDGVPLVPPPVKLPRLDEDGNELRDGGKTTVNPIPRRKSPTPGRKPPLTPGRKTVVPVRRPSLPPSPSPARRSGGGGASTGIAVIGSVAGDIVVEIIEEPLRKVIAPEVTPEEIRHHRDQWNTAINGEILTQEQIKEIADAIRERWEKDKEAWLRALGLLKSPEVREEKQLTEEEVNELHRRYKEEDRVENYVLNGGEIEPESRSEVSPLHDVISERSGGNGTALDDFVRIGGVSDPGGSGSGSGSEDDKECSGPCNYPDQVDRIGKRCGGRAACVRKGGCRPPGGCV